MSNPVATGEGLASDENKLLLFEPFFASFTFCSFLANYFRYLAEWASLRDVVKGQVTP